MFFSGTMFQIRTRKSRTMFKVRACLVGNRKKPDPEMSLVVECDQREWHLIRR